LPDQGQGFHASFNCLWCGRPHTARSSDDLEGWALLCSSCVGKAQDNEFLRYRLRDGLARRGEAAQVRADEDRVMKEYYAARAAEYDDFYLGVGLDPITLARWQADLDDATLWLDALPIQGEIVELAAGTGWWSPLLAQKGELWLYDVGDEVLVRARDRLLAHGLRAHIHLRDAYAEPDRQVDALFCGGWLSHVLPPRLDGFLATCHRWLKPGGLFAFIDEAPREGGTPVVDGRQFRQLKDGREFQVPKMYYERTRLHEALEAAGFKDVEVRTTSRFLVLGKATA
jgi:ubiquinone/menaquinone biosynthesis C-methylase UbiE